MKPAGPRRASMLLLLGGVLLLAQGALQGAGSNTTSLAQSFGVSELITRSLEFHEDLDTGLLYTEIEMPGGQIWTLELRRHSMRSDSFEVLVDDGSGALTPHPAPPILTWRGSVLEVPQSSVRAFFDGAALRALIRTPMRSWAIQPLADAGLRGNPGEHVIYDIATTLPTDHTCGLDTGGQAAPPGTPGPLGTGLKITEVGVDCDYEYYTTNNSSIPQTVSDVEDILNSVEGVYEVAGIGITYEVTRIIVRTVPGSPYTSSSPGTLLDQFQNEWNATPQSYIPQDVAHLFTGKDLSGTVIGIASLFAVCDTFDHYGLSQSRFTNNYNRRVALTAHELGHNWSATHCNGAGNCRIMCSVIAQCSGLNPLTFGPDASAQISSYRNSRTCLTDLAPPQALPFIEEFPSTVLNSQRWSHNAGGQVNTVAVAEPSPPYSLNVDAAGPQANRDDDVRTNFILLWGTSEPTLQYSTEHRGVEAGEELVVEYWASNLTWVEVNRITSNGIDQGSFEVHTHSLPLNARHNEFRVRFRAEVNGSDDDWFIDAISITDGPPPTPDPPQIDLIFPATGPISGGTPVTITGLNFASDAAVLLGNNLLENLQYLSASELQGTTPAVGSAGTVDLAVSQGSGTVVLPDAYTYTAEFLHTGSATAAPGTLGAPVQFIGDHTVPLAGFSIGIDFDGTWLDVAEITLTGTAAEGAEFFGPNLNNDGEPAGSWWTIGVLLSYQQTWMIPPSSSSLLALALFDVSPGAPIGTEVELVPTDGIGDPPVQLVFVAEGGTSITPLSSSGTLSVEGVSFIRGDANMSGAIDVADPIFSLDYQFNNGVATCLDALDANDDGVIDLADPVYGLAHLFNNGQPPPPPHPGAGSDPTPDGLDCN